MRRMLRGVLGVIAGAMLMRSMNNATFKPVIGTLILGLTALQILRMLRPGVRRASPSHAVVFVDHGPAHRGCNDAGVPQGPIFALYYAKPWRCRNSKSWEPSRGSSSSSTPSKFRSASDSASSIARTLLLNAVLAPAVIAGVLGGRWLVTAAAAHVRIVAAGVYANHDATA